MSTATIILLICAGIVTIAIAAAVIFVINTLNQVSRTAREAEILLKKINTEVSTVLHITDTISGFVDRFTSPWVRIGSWFTGVAASMFRKKQKEPSDRTCEKAAV